MQKYIMVRGWLGYTDGIYRSDAQGIVRPGAVDMSERCVDDANTANQRIAEVQFSLAAAELREAQANELLRAATEGLNVCSGALLKANKEHEATRETLRAVLHYLENTAGDDDTLAEDMPVRLYERLRRHAKAGL